ncbi:hypothetical protein FPQ18DRAFT_385338 [Pyronema domesticum]|nr:hypothetical protein FPQ18DRAFT_385338 [Pyronema domesticum]
MAEDASNRPEDEGGQRGPGTGPEFGKYREKSQETASDFSNLTDFEDEEEDEEEDEGDAMEIETNKETNQSSAMIEKPNPEIIEANSPANLDPSSRYLNPPLPNPQPTNPETLENPPQTLHTDVENPAKLTIPKKLKKPAAKEKPKRTEQRDSNREKIRKNHRKLTERNTRNQQRPPSPMDTEAPEAGENAQTMPESTTTETTGQENTAAPKEAKKKPNTATNRGQALLMIYNAIVESNNNVDILSQDLRKVQAQNEVLTRELHKVHQWIGACVKTQGKRPPQNAEKAHTTPETTKQPEKPKEKPAAMTKGIEDSIHAPKNQDTVMIDLNDKTNETQKTKGKQPDKAKANGIQPTKTTIASPTPTMWNKIHLKSQKEWDKEFCE